MHIQQGIQTTFVFFFPENVSFYPNQTFFCLDFSQFSLGGFDNILKSRGGSRAAATSKMERFVIIINGFQPLTIITKRSTLDVAAALDPPLKRVFLNFLFFTIHNYHFTNITIYHR